MYKIKNKPYDLFVLSASTIDNIIKMNGNFPIEGGITRQCKDIFLEPGGEANIIICFNRIGGKALPVGPIGDDLYSDFILKVYKDIDVDVKYLFRVLGYKLPVANAIVDDCGIHTFVSFMPGVDFAEEDIIFAILKECRAYYMSGYYLVKSHHFYDLSLKLMYKAKEFNIPIFFDPGPCLESIDTELKKELEDNIDVFCLNKDEARLLTGIAEIEEACAKLYETTNSLVIVKDGANGCYAMGKDLKGQWFPGFKVKMVDTIGCGDSFLATFMYAYLANFDLKTAFILANAAGAVKAGKFGSGRNVPTFDEIVKLLQNNGYNINVNSLKERRLIDLKL